MVKKVTLGAIMLGWALVAACNSGTALSSHPSQARAVPSPAGVSGTPGVQGAIHVTPEPTNVQAAPLAQPPPTAPNRCPPLVANPVGCPGPLPPQPIAPQGGHARILLCGQLIDSAPLLRGFLAICGAAFRPGESITVTVTGRLGTISWQTTAGANGTFRTALPGAACRLLPAYLSARGNRGSVTNTLPLTMIACPKVAS